MSDFTPGPWTADGFVVETDGDYDIAITRPTVWQPTQSIPAAIANARLIAAAPDMLAALEAVARVGADAFLPGPVPLSISEMNNITAAIAKARGT